MQQSTCEEHRKVLSKHANSSEGHDQDLIAQESVPITVFSTSHPPRGYVGIQCADPNGALLISRAIPMKLPKVPATPSPDIQEGGICH